MLHSTCLCMLLLSYMTVFLYVTYLGINMLRVFASHIWMNTDKLLSWKTSDHSHHLVRRSLVPVLMSALRASVFFLFATEKLFWV